jgi:hypothetical protein
MHRLVTNPNQRLFPTLILEIVQRLVTIGANSYCRQPIILKILSPVQSDDKSQQALYPLDLMTNQSQKISMFRFCEQIKPEVYSVLLLVTYRGCAMMPYAQH